MSDAARGEEKPSIFELRDKVMLQIKPAVKPPTLDELRIRVETLSSHLRFFEDEYYITEDPGFARAYEELYQLYSDLRDFYLGARAILRRISIGNSRRHS